MWLLILLLEHAGELVPKEAIVKRIWGDLAVMDNTRVADERNLRRFEYDHTLSHTASMPAMERVTVTLPADLVEKIDQLERNRSRFIAEAVEHELAQRRKHALLQSVQNPHPETTELIDISLSDWLPDLPADETLVDANGGTPVRWVEGKGWTKESA